MRTDINRTALNIAGVCNLKCKNCLAFIPYYENKWLMGIEEAKAILAKYFEVVDSVGHFTVTGGEPLLNQDLIRILQEVSRYRDQIRDSIDLVSNASIMFSAELINFLNMYNDCFRVILSDYGDNLSVKINEIVEELDKNGINFRVSTFHGEDMYFDGWIDFNDHSLKWTSIEERDFNALKCVHGAGKYFVINDGCIHRCSRSYWRIKTGIIPAVKGEYVPLLDETFSLDEKRELLIGMMQQKSTTSCAYCVGLVNGVPRVEPAIQIE